MSFHPDLWAQGCALCRAALENSAEGRTIAASLKNGILLMLVLPYGLMGTFAFFIYRAYRRRSKEQQQEATSYQAQTGR